MPWPFRKRAQASTALSITPRSTTRQPLTADATALAPTAEEFLAHAAALQAALAGELSQSAAQAWSAQDADGLVRASGEATDRYRRIRELLAEYSKDPVAALVEPRDALARHLQRVQSTRWYERVGTVWVLGGFTRDFSLGLAHGLGSSLADRIAEILADRGDEDMLVEVLGRVLAADERYSSRLSLWARRLVGDAMLVCAETVSANAKADSGLIAKLEPFFVEPIAAHTRRLDRLGLTA